MKRFSATNYRRALKRWAPHLVFTLVGVVAALVLWMGVQTFSARAQFEDHVGQVSPTQNWLDRKLTRYSQEIYDLLQSMLRLRSAAFAFHLNRIDRDEYLSAVDSVSAKYEHFLPGTSMANALAMESFNDASASADALIRVANLYAERRATLDEVLEANERAVDDWHLLSSDNIKIEFGLRDKMEAAIITLRPTVMESFVISMTIIGVSLVVLAVAVWVSFLWFRAERRRHASVERLISSIGHDLRSPLQAIHSSIGILRRNPSPERVQTFVEILRTSSSTMARLVDDLVHLARQEELPYKPTEQDLSAWCDSLLLVYEDRVRTKGLAWSARCSIDWIFVRFDADRLNQVVGNLIDNAVKYTDKGSVEVSLLLKTNPDQGSVAMLEFVVKDSGIGIDAADLDRVFLPFERSQNAIARSGTGLGLSIVHAIVTEQGGSVELTSELGKGTTITVLFPVALSDREAYLQAHERGEDKLKVFEPLASLPPCAQECGGEAFDVLLVDDDEAIRLSLRAVLADAGLRVKTARNGKEALTILQQRARPPIVVTDVNMPVMDGFELARACRELPVPPYIIGQSAFAKDLSQHPDAVLFNESLTKPVDDKLLVSAIRKARKAS